MLVLISPKSRLLYLFLTPSRLLGIRVFKSLISAPYPWWGFHVPRSPLTGSKRIVHPLVHKEAVSLSLGNKFKT